jgi:LmbE family N-acetylglucosaminyl deacetylase
MGVAGPTAGGGVCQHDLVRVLVTVAHPDDESFGFGSVIAWCVRHGADVVVASATRGERGERADGGTGPLAEAREQELRDAAAVLGASAVELLDFEDSDMVGELAPGTLAGAPFAEVVAAVARLVDRHRPDVVVTFDPDGHDGHRDHTRVGGATIAAVEALADPPRLYLWTLSRDHLRAWHRLVVAADPSAGHAGFDPDQMGRPLAECTTVLDVSRLIDIRRRAIDCHRSQVPPFAVMPPELTESFLSIDGLVRRIPPWEGGEVETALW